jgi:YesN/AraC family two-component response regulator
MNHTLLIADDEELIRQGIIARLEYLNIKLDAIYEASNGHQAFEIMQKHEVDIVITDIRMDDMDGLSFIKQAKPLFPRVQFIILSGYNDFSYAEQAIRLGVKAYLLKPISNDALRDVMEEADLKLQEGQNLNQKISEGTHSIAEMKQYLLEKNINDLLRDEEAYKRKQVYDSVASGFDMKNEWIMLGVIHINRDSYEKNGFSYKDIDLILFTIRNIFLELESKCKKIIVNNLANRNQLYAVLCLENDDLIKKEVEQLFIRLKDITLGKMGLSLAVGISSPRKLLSTDSTKEAQEAVLQRIISGNSGIYFYDDIKLLSSNLLPTCELNKLYQYIERHDAVNIEHMINEILSEEKTKGHNITYIRIILVRINDMLLKTTNTTYTKNPDIVEKLALYLEALNSFYSLKDLRSHLLSLILGCINTDEDFDINSKNKIKLAIKYINDNYNTDIAINELAEKYNMSPNYFSAVFKRETGQTTVNYIKNIRLERACHYLIYSDKSVVEISKEVGYQDSQYFFKIFKKATGQTPLVYRRMHIT